MSEKPIIPEKPDPSLYQIVAERRIAYDGMMWQAPFLSLTAQAFLLTIALSADTYPTGRIISALLGVFAAGASIQLMLKHRCNELADSKWLQAYEELHSECRPIHAKRRSFSTTTFITDVPSTWVWIAALAVFGAAALFALIIAVGCPHCLGHAVAA